MFIFQSVLSRWWFEPFFIFTPIWGRCPIWLIFFRWVETTNQLSLDVGAESRNMTKQKHLADTWFTLLKNQLFTPSKRGHFNLNVPFPALLGCLCLFGKLKTCFSEMFCNHKKQPPLYFMQETPLFLQHEWLWLIKHEVIHKNQPLGNSAQWRMDVGWEFDLNSHHQHLQAFSPGQGTNP